MSGHEHGGHPHPGTGKHGMLLVGLDPICASHLPMFHPPHDFQLLAAVDLDGADAYREDRRTSGEPVYTLDPERFSWKELLPDGSDPPKRSSFLADVYRGHFERRGTRILEQARVDVVRVAYFAQLTASEPRRDELTYRALGHGTDRFLAHEIHGAPSFDHVVSFRFEDPEFAEVEVTGDPVVFDERADATDQRLRPGETLPASFPSSIGPTGQHGFTTRLAVLEESYLEVGELAG